nr:putative ribonuclease H-like domain-containing protein [Tanacetum cinerariifolium]
DISNISATYHVPTTSNTRIHKDHYLDDVIGDIQSGVQTRRMKVFRSKKDERGIVIRNKARLVTQGCTQVEGIDHDKVFAHVAQIKAIRLYLAYASFMGFLVYLMDLKSAFLYGRIKEEVYVYQPLGFEEPDYPDKVYKVEKALYGLHQAPRTTLDNGEIELNATVDGQVKTITEASVRRQLKLAYADGISTLPTTEFFKQLALMGATTTASSLQAEQGNGNISKNQTKATPYGPSSLRTSSEGGPGCHVTMRDSHVQVRPERLSNLPNEPPLGEGKTSQSTEGSMQLLELMDICTKLSDKVTTLDNELTSTKVVYNTALITLTKRLKKLGKKLKHKRRMAIIVFSEDEEASSQTDDDETLAETMLNIKRSVAKDKGKAIMQESEPPKKIKKKEMMQISLDEEIAKRFYEEGHAQILMDEEYAEQVQDQWISDEARLDQENLAQAK